MGDERRDGGGRRSNRAGRLHEDGRFRPCLPRVRQRRPSAIRRQLTRPMGTYSAHLDTFARDSLPAPDQQPDFIFTLPELDYPERLNCVSELLDAWVERGDGNRPVVA